MVDSVSIRNKFTEFRAEYANRNIDDFDTFVCARVADYFINNEQASTDTIYAAIEKALCEPVIEEDEAEEITGEDSHSDVPPPPPVTQVSLPKKLLKAAPYIAGAATVGFIAWVVKRKKRK